MKLKINLFPLNFLRQRKSSWLSKLKYIIIALVAGLTITGSPVAVQPIDPARYTNADKVQGFYRGSGVKVAIIDTGANFYAYQLYHKIDPDFINTENFDFCGHGTYTTSLVNAIAPEAILLPYRTGDVCNGSYSKIASSIKDAYERGARVVVITQAGRFRYSPLQDVINEYYNKGVFIISSSGNTGANELIYPGAFDNVFTVGNLGQDGNVFASSTYGEHVDFLAPGHAVRGLYYWPDLRRQGEVALDGSSASAPIVAGVVALMLEKEPHLSNEEIKNRLLSSGDIVQHNGHTYRSLNILALFNMYFLYLPSIEIAENLRILQCTPYYPAC